MADAPSNLTPLQEVLRRNVDNLEPGAEQHLAALWHDDFRGLSPAQASELVAARLHRAENALFCRPGYGARPPLATAAAAPAISLKDYPGLSSDDEARRVHAAG